MSADVTQISDSFLRDALRRTRHELETLAVDVRPPSQRTGQLLLVLLEFAEYQAVEIAILRSRLASLEKRNPHI